MNKPPIIWSDSIDSILQTGISLVEYGVSNFALSKTDALIAIEKLQSMGVIILGGDVYTREYNNWKSTGDNWYITHEEEQLGQKCVALSSERSVKFINNYKTDNAYFAIVPKVDS